MKRKLSIEQLRRHAQAHEVDWEAMDLTSPIDRLLPFLCESLTPLFYAPVYLELTPAQRLRYNQISGLAFNELITFFEVNIAQSMLETLVHRPGTLPADLVAALVGFAADERRHTAAFQALNRLAEPSWYAATDRFVLPPSPGGELMMRSLARHPAYFPAILWLGLVMEEKALAASRALLSADAIEPHFLAVYREHLRDEVRHVHLDWHLLSHFYEGRPRWLRVVNARLFGFLLKNFFLAPIRAGRRVTDLWLAEHPELESLRSRILRETLALGGDRGYLQMMYSREVTPIAFELFDRYSEFHLLGKYLASYIPTASESAP